MKFLAAQILDSRSSLRQVLLTWAPGIGKMLFSQWFAEQIEAKYLYQLCHTWITDENLVAHSTQSKGSFVNNDLNREDLPPEPTEVELIAAMRLTRDLKKAAAVLNEEQARYLVDLYYALQKLRIGATAQIRSASDEPNQLLTWTKEMYETLEADVRSALEIYAKSQVPGLWTLSVKGIGPVLAAGLLAHITIENTPTVGALWRYAGYDPSINWLGPVRATSLVKEVTGFSKLKQIVTDEQLIEIAQKTNYSTKILYNTCKDDDGDITCTSLIKKLSRRPWNARLKTLGWKIGQSFVKVSNREGAFYGHLLRERKLYEIEHNTMQEREEQAKMILLQKKIGVDTEAYKYYSMGILPPGHIQSRAERYAVKIFLSHLHTVMYENHYGRPAPRPYAIQFLGHAHEIGIPNWPIKE